MEFRFELPDGYSYQDVLALMRVLIRKRKIGRWVRLLSRIFLISAGCILLWISCSQWNRVREGYALLLAAMIVGILGVAAGVFVYSAHVAAWLSWRMQATYVSFISSISSSRRPGFLNFIVTKRRKPVNSLTSF